jgi:hypothetical protein
MYSLRLTMARLPKGADSSISMAFLGICAEKILRLPRLFFFAYMSGSAPGITPESSGPIHEKFTCLKLANRWLLCSRNLEQSTALFFYRA